jgi:TatD DNase family protein
MLLTETDGPFVKTDHRNARPADVAKTIAVLAELRAMPADELAKAVSANLKRLVSG